MGGVEGARGATGTIEKLRYMHRNPVTRVPTKRLEDWSWSSFGHYLAGERGRMEIES